MGHIVWNGDNLEEIIEFCGESKVIFNVDEQQLYLILKEGEEPTLIPYGHIVTYDF